MKTNTTTLEAWRGVWGDTPQDGVDDLARNYAFYAKYPAELADELAVDFGRYLYFGRPPTPEEHLYLFYLSPIVTTYWSMLIPLIPQCPVDPEAFERFGEAVRAGDTEAYLRCLEGVRTQIQKFDLWLRATGGWSNRPGESESADRGVPCNRILMVMSQVIADNPQLKAKGGPDSVMKRVRERCKEEGLPGINEQEGLRMIREIKGLPKRAVRRD